MDRMRKYGGFAVLVLLMLGVAMWSEAQAWTKQEAEDKYYDAEIKQSEANGKLGTLSSEKAAAWSAISGLQSWYANNWQDPDWTDTLRNNFVTAFDEAYDNMNGYEESNVEYFYDLALTAIEQADWYFYDSYPTYYAIQDWNNCYAVANNALGYYGDTVTQVQEANLNLFIANQRITTMNNIKNQITP